MGRVEKYNKLKHTSEEKYKQHMNSYALSTQDIVKYTCNDIIDDMRGMDITSSPPIRGGNGMDDHQELDSAIMGCVSVDGVSADSILWKRVKRKELSIGMMQSMRISRNQFIQRLGFSSERDYEQWKLNKNSTQGPERRKYKNVNFEVIDSKNTKKS